MVQTHGAGARSLGVQALQPFQIVRNGNGPGVTDPEGAGVRPSRQEAMEVIESTETVR
jgi:hypothetical protein